jgi:hypothetical protein
VALVGTAYADAVHLINARGPLKETGRCGRGLSLSNDHRRLSHMRVIPDAGTSRSNSLIVDLAISILWFLAALPIALALWFLLPQF